MLDYSRKSAETFACGEVRNRGGSCKNGYQYQRGGGTQDTNWREAAQRCPSLHKEVQEELLSGCVLGKLNSWNTTPAPRIWCAWRPLEDIKGSTYEAGRRQSSLEKELSNLSIIWKRPVGIWVRFLGREDPLGEGMTIQSSIPAWRIPTDRGAWSATVHGVTKSQTQLSD